MQNLNYEDYFIPNEIDIRRGTQNPKLDLQLYVALLTSG